MSGRFITLEGIEGSGKSTLAKRLAAALTERGATVVATREPGGTPLAEQVRALALSRSAEPVPPAAELLLMFAARALHVENRIRPALAHGGWVLCDRFTDATRAYQGSGRGLSSQLIETLAVASHPGLTPDRTLLLDLPAEAGLARARSRADGGDRFEDEALAFFNRVRRGYLELADREPNRFRIIDASRTADDVLAASLAALDDLWP
ncbi:MAG: dTMP kinase [Steroidobacteraceae bacterium]